MLIGGVSEVSVTYGIMAPMAHPTKNRVSARIAAVSPSATLAVDAKAKALQAQGENVIGFGAGEPDFPTPDHIVAAAVAACRDPKAHKYSPTAGLPELREALAAKTRRDSDSHRTRRQVQRHCGFGHDEGDRLAG